MLSAVEGGGFFSSSASGYSKGLTLLLLGQKDEEKPMRVTPWNQYQLVDQETDPDLQLASGKNRLVGRCASFVCFGRTDTGLESPSPLKVEPTGNQEILQASLVFDESKYKAHSVDPVDDDHSNTKIVSLKSNLKKLVDSASVSDAVVDGDGGNNTKHDFLCEKDNVVTCQMEKRKVQWTDTIGGELFEIREFEMSEHGSDDAFDHGNGKSCSCRIM